jgi:hypothetical protein
MWKYSTVHFGKPSLYTFLSSIQVLKSISAKEHKRAFTRVLQAHIGVDALIYPAGTSGTNLGTFVVRFRNVLVLTSAY